jgi:hypothetical protein
VLVPRLTRLIRSIDRPDAHAVGTWTAADVALHLGHVWQVLPALVKGEMEPPLRTVGDLAPLTQTMVQAESGRDLAEVSAGIESAARAFFESLDGRGAGQKSPWLIAGVETTAETFACHVLNETLIHGFDIARSQRLDWPIDRDHAALALMHFVFPMAAMVDPREIVVQERAAGLHACWEIRVRRAGRVFLTLDDGDMRITDSPKRPVDCHLSADPAALFLVMWGRKSQWPSVLTGRLTAWGRRPWLGPRLRSLLRNP